MRASLEREVLDILRSAVRPLPVREVLERVNARRGSPLAYTTVMTVLRRLTDKDAAVRHDDDGRHVYRATADSEAELAVRRVVAEHGDAALASFLRLLAADPALREQAHASAARRPDVAERRGPTGRPRLWTDVYFGPPQPVAGDEDGDDWTRWVAG
ncbi:BlaI/MecI/CopY family transcriptional regulator [Saccharothrix australiensis]|uniref:CopY family transcriptional repressor n=1 Tax=Saccharothrix australiensis TaxID=2072 RepID=A0A495W167_9PSEU|nr:BlaI/MecI/CopY family transcriptional regulator [Saccharothrix australiensis]RKT55144.1 CopY family transcriptional repressor [Saccharothrix australiensis]